MSSLGISGALTVRGVRRNWGYWLRNRLRLEFWRGRAQVFAAGVANKLFGVATITSELSAVLTHADGTEEDLGVLSNRMVTTAYVEFLAAQHATESSLIGDFKYHDSGVGATNPAITDTVIETTDGESRVTGTQVASTNTYTSVATITYYTSKSITEHGIFNDATAGTLLDRSEFAAIAVVNSDRLAYTYVLTFTAGG